MRNNHHHALRQVPLAGQPEPSSRETPLVLSGLLHAGRPPLHVVTVGASQIRRQEWVVLRPVQEAATSSRHPAHHKACIRNCGTLLENIFQ